jgi:hypothetical protein
MLCVKSKMVAAMLAIAAGVAWTSMAQAGTDLSNIAWKQPVSGNSYGGVFYGRVFKPDDVGYVVVGYDEAEVLVNDGLASDTNYTYPRWDGGGAWIDLGATYEIASIEILPQNTGKWNVLELATVYGSSQKTTDAEYSFIIPDKGSSNLSHVQNVDWHGVRWIRLVDESDFYIGVGDANFLTIGDVRVMGKATTYTSGSLKFIGGVTATATSTRNSPLTYSPNFLVNHNGMSDQHGPVGNTSAKADANVGLWMNENTVSYVNQAVTFDLNGNYNLDRIQIWNHYEASWSTSNLAYTDYTNRGVNAALIEYSRDGGNTWIALPDTNGSTEGNYSIPKATLTVDSENYLQSVSSQLTISLTDLLADHVRLTVKSNWGHTTYAGLSEVRFYGDAVVVPGDTNLDGRVNEVDAQTVNDWWGATVTSGDVAKGDFNHDGHVNAADAAIMAANWTGAAEGAGAAGGAVPEPSTLVLLAALGLATCVVRRAR